MHKHLRVGLVAGMLLAVGGSAPVWGSQAAAKSDALVPCPPYIIGNGAATRGNCYGTSGIGGSGTPNYLAKFTDATTLGNSLVYELNGNVGIGTISPGATLDVVGNGRFSTKINTNLVNDYSESRNLLSLTGGVLQVGDTNTDVTLPRNVGIGTTTPSQKLTVVGTIESTSGGFKFPDGSVQLAAAGASPWAVSGSNISNTNTGNVGIGTSSPTQKLEANGGLRLNTSSSKPVCDAQTRGTVWVSQSDSGDVVEVCKLKGVTVKNATLPTGSFYHSCVEASNTHDVYCFGGGGGSSWFNQILAYTSVTDRLVTKTATLPSGRGEFSCAEDSSTHKLYCFGGYTGSYPTPFLNEIVEYSSSTDTLITKTTTLPSGRLGLSCAQDSSTHKIYCFGGWDGSQVLNQILEYTPSTDTLVTKTAILPTPRYNFSCAEDSGTHHIYCFGGYDGGNFYNQILEYTPSTDSLTVKTATLPTARYGPSCAENSLTHHLYCFGGFDGNSLNQILEYTPSTDSLAVKTATLPSSRYAASCAEDSALHNLYCFGGFGGGWLNQIVETSSLMFEWVRLD